MWGAATPRSAPPLIKAGYQVTVAGSAPVCGIRLEPWTSTGRCRFDVADLQHLPYDDATFDAVVCYRLLAHSVNWTSLIRELCRVARHRVILDYPARRSVNIVSRRLFDLKRSIEGIMTRRFSLYGREEIARAFEAGGLPGGGRTAAVSAPHGALPPDALGHVRPGGGVAGAQDGADASARLTGHRPGRPPATGLTRRWAGDDE